MLFFLIAISTLTKAQVKTCETYKTTFLHILSYAKIDPSTVEFECSENVMNAQYSNVKGKGIFKIQQNYFQDSHLAFFCAVISHEIGHHILKHYGKTKAEDEGNADFYCGYFMRKLGYSAVEIAYEFLLDSGKNASTDYPSRSERKARIQDGWNKANKELDQFSDAFFNPKVIWKIINGQMVINIDQREIKLDYWMPRGVLYDEVSGSTFQLLNYKNEKGASGLGRLVTNSSNFTYQRTAENKYQIYNKGLIVKNEECYNNNPVPIDGDVIVKCWDRNKSRDIEYKLKDYELAPQDYILPAYKIIE